MSRQSPPATDRYGPASFIAALITMPIVETATWMWWPYIIVSPLALGVVTALVLPTAFVLMDGSTRSGQIGRGILIGYLATLLTVAIALAVALVAALRSMWFS